MGVQYNHERPGDVKSTVKFLMGKGVVGMGEGITIVGLKFRF